MFELFPTGKRIAFMKYKTPMVVFSVAISVFSIYLMFTKGFKFGVDFQGGVEIVASFAEDTGVTADRLREAFGKMGIQDASIQTFGTQFEKRKNEFIIHFSSEFSDPTKVQTLLANKIQTAFKTGPNPVASLRFSGMERAYLTLAEKQDLAKLSEALKGIDFGMLQLVDVQPFGRDTSNEYQLNFKSIASVIYDGLAAEFKSAQTPAITIEKVDFVGAKVGRDLKISAILSLLITIILVFIYIFIRFELKYAPGVIVALIHDVVITAGVFSLTGLEFDLTTVAALLTLAGYSINDTIVIYDRIREVAHNLRGKKFSEIIDIAISDTLGRTFITGGTTLMTTIIMWIYGGPVIHGFALALTVGIIVGTYSSVFIASPTVLLMERLTEGKKATKGRQAA